MRLRLHFAFALCLGLLLAPARAVQPGEQLADPALEARARSLSSELRCMVCQNQSVDDSDAALARDVRLIVRERLQAGDSDARVQQFLVARYGDFILLKPPVKPGTLLLWSAPFLVLLLGGLGIYAAARRARTDDLEPEPLSASEARALDQALGEAGAQAPLATSNLTKNSS